MALNWSDVSQLVKTEYLPTVEDIIIQDDFMTKYIKKMKKVENVSQTFTKAFNYGLSEGTKVMNNYTDQLAQAGRRTYKTFTGTTKYRNGVIKIYEPIAKLMQKDEKAFIDELQNEIEGITLAMKAEQERMAYGDAGISALCTLASDATSSTASPLTLSLASGSSTKFLRPGMQIDILDSSHASIANAGGLEVGDILDDTSFTVVTSATGADLTALLSAIDGGLVYHVGGYNNEPHGLGSLFGKADNTVFGVNRSTAAGTWFKPMLYKATANGVVSGTASANADWDLSDLDKIVKTQTLQKKAKHSDLKMFTTPGVEAYALALRQAIGEYALPSENIDLWPYKVYSFNGVPMLSSYSMQENTLYSIDMSKFVRFESDPLHFSDMDGNMWKWVSNYAAYCAYLLEAYELGHYAPQRCACVTGLNSSY